MKKLLIPLLLAAASAQAADRASDEEMIQQGRDLVRKYTEQINAETGSSYKQSLNTQQIEASLPDRRALPSSQKDMLDLATGKKNLANMDKRKKTDLLIFVSFSIPEVTLQQYSKQAAEYGAVLVLRGLHENSLEKTKYAAFAANPSGVEWDIAPATFKKFKIDRVPAIVLADASNESVLENGCAKEGDYLRVDGEVSIHQALVLMKQFGDNRKLAKAAETYLDIENQ